MDNNASNGRRVVLLDDLPATNDAFGGHQRIADAISQMVGCEIGGKAIALIGSWGGGKSTVINILKKRYQGQDNTTEKVAIFVFDAWAHEGDPLRRIFLERLITFLSDRNWVNSKAWKEKLSELSRKLVVTETETTPKLTIHGVVAAVAVLVGAVGLAMVSAGITEFWWNLPGFLLTLVPFGVFAYGWCVSRWKSSDDMLRYFVNKHRESNTTSTVETPEPTTVEFQEWFCQLLDEAITADRRIVIVIDNLDRVDPDDALKLWSAMRTFVDLPEVQLPTWMSRLWVLAAFDESGIKRLWGKSENEKLADTFLQKTFQIRFRIPAPLLSDWRTFLTNQLGVAFPDGKPDDFYRITRIYGILRADKKPPTPRDMKVFVNQIGAALRTAPSDQIPLPHIALYTLLVDAAWDLTKDLPEKDQLQAHLGTDFENDLAALLYSMPSEQAIQVLLQQQVEKAFADGVSEPLQHHASRGWLGDVIDQVISQRMPEWSRNEPQLIGRVARALTVSDAVAAKVHAQTIQRLSNELKRVTEWHRMDQACGEGIAALLKSHQSGLAKPLFSALSKTSFEGSKKASANGNEKQWVLGVSSILAAAVQTGLPELGDFIVGESPADYLAVIGEVQASCPRDLWPHWRPKCTPASVIAQLNGDTTTGNLTDARIRAMHVMMAVPLEWEWGTFTALFNRLGASSQLNLDTAQRCLETLLLLRKTPLSQTLTQFVQGGWAFHHLSFATSANNTVTALAVLAILLVDPDPAHGANPTPQAPQGRGQYRNIALRPDQHTGVIDLIIAAAENLSCAAEILVRRSQSANSTALLDLLLRRLAERHISGEVFPPEMIVSHYVTLKIALDADTLANFLRSSSDRGTLELELLKAQFTPSSAGLFRSSMQLRKTDALLKRIIDGLKHVTGDDWLTSLTRADDLIPLVKDLVNSNVALGLSIPLQDALSAFADKLLSQESPDHIDAETCETLIKALSEEQRRAFKRSLLNKIISADEPTHRIISRFSNALSDCEVLGSKADDLVQEGFRKMLQRAEIHELEWVKRVLQMCPQLSQQCPRDVLQDFYERVQREDKQRFSADISKLMGEIQTTVQGLVQPSQM